MLKFIVFATILAYAFAEQKATVTLMGPKVTGRVNFTKTGKNIMIEGELRGLTPGKHGFHVHEFGDLSNGCVTTGAHFNPYKKNHGGPDAKERHVGDLGNIIADDKGVAKIKFNDSKIDLDGECNIIGRAVVVHTGEDDYGLGGQADSNTTGHAGGREACGIIGRLSSFGMNFTPSLSVLLLTAIIGYFAH